MADHNDFGKLAEDKATEFLQKLGYQIIARNWRFQKAEIDIIAKDNAAAELVIVEVKARKNDDIANPEDAINKKKIQLLVKATDEFVCQYYQEDCNVRFDILSITIEQKQLKIQHIKNAFESIDAN